MEAFWDDVEKRFFRLHEEQVSGNSFLYALNDGDAWTIGGSTKNAKQQFEWLAERAALRLGVPPGRGPVFSWLDRLKKESPRYKEIHSDSIRRKSELDSNEMCSLERDVSHSEGGVIELLCRASGEYCIRCDTQAFAPAPESPTAIPSRKHGPIPPAVVQSQSLESSASVPDAHTGDTANNSGASTRKGDPTLLDGKERVTLRTAEQYLGIRGRQRQKLINRGSLIVEGQGQNRQQPNP